MIYDLAFWQNQIKMRDDCAVRYSIRVLRDVVVLSVHSREFINYVNPLSKCHVISWSPKTVKTRLKMVFDTFIKQCVITLN